MALFIRNPFFESEFKREPHTRLAMAAEAEKVAQIAKQFAPVLSGDYRDSIEVVLFEGDVWVVAKDWKGGFIEWGTVRTPTFAPIRLAVKAAGLQLNLYPKP